MYWKTPDVGHVTAERIFSKDKDERCFYDFIDKSIGKHYSDLTDFADVYYEKGNERKYFGKIITYFNFLGLLQLDFTDDANSEIVQANRLLEFIYKEHNRGNKSIIKEYMNYFLVNWQFPMPNISEHRTEPILKPYLIILKILTLLYKRDINEAYLSMHDFYRLFEEPNINTYDDINELYIDDILSSRTQRVMMDISDLKRKTSYYKALLKESFIITEDASIYNFPTDFMIGLNRSENVIKVAEFLISNYSKTVFEFDADVSSTDKHVITEWAKYVNDFNKFLGWRRLYMILTDVNSFKEYCRENGYYYDDNLIRRFITSLDAKPFLIITGISGSGKTKIAELWGRYKSNVKMISIGSNWTDNKKLLGFKNILISDDESYIKTELVEFIDAANSDQLNEYIVILDEMNLSHVERYFSDFLSALESIDKNITLPDGSQIKWTNNLKIIGTVNVDETTYMFSPKVLDRANVIEMNGSKPSVYIDSMSDKANKPYLEIKDKQWFSEYKEILDLIYEKLNGNFAYRVIDEITIYLSLNTRLFGDEDFIKYFDEQVYQKILPKLYGSKSILKPKLDGLQDVLGSREGFNNSTKKIKEMLNSLENGFASFVGD